MNLKTILKISVSTLTILILVACTTPTAPTQSLPPTQDPKVIRTEAVQTAMAQLTAQAAANPTNTPVPPQPSPRPVTATPITPTVPPTLAPTLTALPTLTFTPRPVGVYQPPTPTKFSLNRAVVLATTPKDWSTIPKDNDFDIRWWVRNTGSVDWNTAYYIEYISGSKVHRKDYYYLRYNVPINSDIEVIVDARSGMEQGLLSTRWGLYDNKGEMFQLLTLNVYVK